MRPLAAYALVALAACAPAARPESPAKAPASAVEATSLLGEPLVAPALPAEVRAEREAQLEAAREASAAAPGDPDALIWLGRRTAYLGRYREAVDLFTRGVERHPDDARFLRHRGHRSITLRRFADAEADLERAVRLVAGRPDEVEPDGLPNARGIPTSTLQSNVWYHLGLARYLQADFEGSLAAYRSCLAVSANPDMLVATSYWLHLTLRRLGLTTEARQVLEPIRSDLDVIENHAYHRLLLMARGEVEPDALLAEARSGGELDGATVGYGVGAWHLANGRRGEAERIFREVVAAGPWASFGAIAAEAELARAPQPHGNS